MSDHAGDDELVDVDDLEPVDDADLAGGVVHEVIPDALVGERLDRVVSLVTGMPRSDASALIAAGGVDLNGRTTTTRTARLSEGDALVLRWAPAPRAEGLVPDPSVDVPVVYADDDVIVVDKPAGLVVHPGAGNPGGTVVNGLLVRFPEIAAVGQPDRPGVVHRIDKETSGLLVVARSEDAYDSLVGQLAARSVHRRYTALVWGALDNTAGTVDAPIGRSRREPTRMTVSERGREAVTHYRVEATYEDPAVVSLLRCRLETGRTHQIRVHLNAIGHPVVGDDRYHGVRAAFTVPRLFLHAAELGFLHPATGEDVSFTSPLPADLQGALDRVR